MTPPYYDIHTERIETIECLSRAAAYSDYILKEIAWLIAERKRFREALEFYAVDEDGGDIAQLELTR